MGSEQVKTAVVKRLRKRKEERVSAKVREIKSIVGQVEGIVLSI